MLARARAHTHTHTHMEIHLNKVCKYLPNNGDMTSKGLFTHQETKKDWHHILHAVRKEMVDTALLLLLSLLLLFCVCVCVSVRERDTARVLEIGKSSVNANWTVSVTGIVKGLFSRFQHNWDTTPIIKEIRKMFLIIIPAYFPTILCIKHFVFKSIFIPKNSV